MIRKVKIGRLIAVGAAALMTLALVTAGRAPGQDAVPFQSGIDKQPFQNGTQPEAGVTPTMLKGNAWFTMNDSFVGRLVDAQVSRALGPVGDQIYAPAGETFVLLTIRIHNRSGHAMEAPYNSAKWITTENGMHGYDVDQALTNEANSMPQSGAGLKPMIPAGAQDTMFAVYRIPEDFAHGRLYYAASWNPWFSRLSLVALPIKDAPARDNGGIVKPGN